VRPMLPYVAPCGGLAHWYPNLTHSLRCGLFYDRRLRRLSHRMNISDFQSFPSLKNVETRGPGLSAWAALFAPAALVRCLPDLEAGCDLYPCFRSSSRVRQRLMPNRLEPRSRRRCVPVLMPSMVL